jgi:hypothetical protein
MLAVMQCTAAAAAAAAATLAASYYKWGRCYAVQNTAVHAASATTPGLDCSAAVNTLLLLLLLLQVPCCASPWVSMAQWRNALLLLLNWHKPVQMQMVLCSGGRCCCLQRRTAPHHG